jgi:hypothetical protein
VDSKRQALDDIVREADRRALVAGIVDLQHPDSGAVIDRGELIQPSARAGDSPEKIDVHLQPVARLRFLVSLPALSLRAVLLIRREPAHAMLSQDSMHGGGRDRYPMKSLEILGGSAQSKMVRLP